MNYKMLTNLYKIKISEKFYFFLIGCIFIFLNFKYTVITGLQHDYHAVVMMSKNVINGKNPWELHSNFYGPILWAISSLTYFHDLIPKIINFIAWNLTLLIILSKVKKDFFLKILIFCLFNSPNFWVEIFKFGHFEGILVFLIIISIFFYEKNFFLFSGIVIGIAVCLKLTAIIIVPFLIFVSFNKEKFFKVEINYNFLFGFLLIVFIIYGLTILFYDFKSIINLSRIGFVRAEHMSFFRFLIGDFSPIPVITFEIFDKKVELLSYISYPVIFLTYMSIFYNFLKKNIDLKNTLLFITLAVPFVYKSGYAQYYTIHFVVFFYYLSDLRINEYDKAISKILLLLLPLIFVTYFNFMHGYAAHIFHELGEEPFWGGGNFGSLKIQEWAGLLSLVFILPSLFYYYNNKFQNFLKSELK